MRVGYRGFLVLTAATVAAICLAIVAFNLAINPYGIWPDLINGRLAKKTARINSVRMVKAYDLLRGCPDAVITGMSSVVWGVDPRRYPVPNERLYNGGIVGSTAVEQYAYVKSFLDQCPGIRKLYIDVNFESFHNSRIPPSDFQYDRLGRRFPIFDDILFTTFSRSAILASINTVNYHRTGLVDQMMFDRGDGFHRVPEASHEVYKNNFIMYLTTATRRIDYEIDDMQVEFFREMVRLADSRGVEVQVYFAPIHYWLHYMRRYDGSTAPLQFELKRRIAQIHDFWDFNLYNRISTEPVDRADWFIDMIHYRPKTGEAVLSVINGMRPAAMPGNFGVKVTKDNIEEHLREFNAGLDHWERDFPEDANRIRAAYGPPSLPPAR